MAVQDYCEHVGMQPDIVIQNAGAMFKDKQITSDGIELTMQTNAIAPALFSLGVLKQLGVEGKLTGTTRLLHTCANVYKTVANVDFLQTAHDPPTYDFWKVYSQSKCAQLLIANYLQSVSSGVINNEDLKFLVGKLSSVAYDPGYIKTQLVRKEYGFTEQDIDKKMGAAKMTVDQGAEMLVYCGVTQDDLAGQFVVRGKVNK